MKNWKATIGHLTAAFLLTAAILGLAWLPAELVAALGCRNRGLWAAAIALCSGLAGVVMAIFALAGKLRGKKDTGRLIACSLAYSLPLVLILWFA